MSSPTAAAGVRRGGARPPASEGSAGRGGAGGYPPVHPGLTRPVLLAGVERPVLGMEAMLVLGLAATIGPRLVTVGVAALVLGVVHPLMARLTARDPMLTAVYARSLRWRAHYPAHSGLRARSHAVPTLPPLA